MSFTPTVTLLKWRGTALQGRLNESKAACGLRRGAGADDSKWWTVGPAGFTRLGLRSPRRWGPRRPCFMGHGRSEDKNVAGVLHWKRTHASTYYGQCIPHLSVCDGGGNKNWHAFRLASSVGRGRTR
eukprot:6396244-Prorocentrum_lima.AAC.1